MDSNLDSTPRPAGDAGGAGRAASPSDVLPGLMHRRQVLRFGGVAVAASAVLAACMGASPTVAVVPPTTAATVFPPSARDATVLRTASSIEALAVAVYTKALATGLVTTSSTADLLKLFLSHHGQHSDLFHRATRTAGGQPFTDPNPVLMRQVAAPRLAALATEAEVVSLAYDVEHLLAATYQSDIGTFDNPKFNTTTASVGAAEGRHLALLAVLSGRSATGTPDGAFQVDTDAAAPGTGI